MSLPNYLSSIKSSGIYRFVWDKSEIAGVDAEVLRLVVGYSDKGPFNTPVYIRSVAEFTKIFGGINKKLERKGIFFHRMAIQALSAGPILALNLKGFDKEEVKALRINSDSGLFNENTNDDSNLVQVPIENIYNTSRFWTLEPEKLAEYKVNTNNPEVANYLYISATDSKEASCSIFLRGCSVKGYDVTLKSWYDKLGQDLPDYCEGYENLLVSDFYAKVYVFKGEFTKQIATSEALQRYFTIDNDKVCLKEFITNDFGDKIDTLSALANDENSSFINSYEGFLLPNFQDLNGNYVSLDYIFNSGYDLHKMMMYINEDYFGEGRTLANCTTNAFFNERKSLTLTVDNYTKIEVVINGNSLEFENTEDSNTNTCFDADIIEYTLPEIESAIEITIPNPDYSQEDAEQDPDGYNVPETIQTTGYNLKNTNKKFESLFSIGSRILANNVVYTVVNVSKNDDDSTINVLAVDNNGEPLPDITTTLQIINHNAGETNKGLEPIYLEGYNYEYLATAKDNKERIDQILSVLKNYQGIRIGLTSRVDLDYRYIVDTFESYIGTNLKSQLSIIAKEKDNALALLNFPSIKTFAKNSKFNKENAKFEIKHIAQGRNPLIDPNVSFSLVSEADGASYVSYNTPLVFSDGPSKVTVPSAALVSNNFMEKYLSRQPYYIVAGPIYGKMNYSDLIGPDFNFSRADLDILEPMGVNAMVYVPRKGTYINSNQTAKQNPVTALSKINVRELVIYLQDEIEKLLQNYQWEFNTQTLRDLIKEKADYICERVKANGGIYNYLNVCDESNNTDEVINNEMFVLSTSIEPGMGCGKMVQELTIYRKGGMSSIIK